MDLNQLKLMLRLDSVCFLRKVSEDPDHLIGIQLGHRAFVENRFQRAEHRLEFDCEPLVVWAH